MSDLTPKERESYREGTWLADSGPRCAVCGDTIDNHEVVGLDRSLGRCRRCLVCSCKQYEERKS